jgi:hypothetical protein
MNDFLALLAAFAFLLFFIGLVTLLIKVLWSGTHPNMLSEPVKEFNKAAEEVGLVMSRMSNNNDYQFLYDSYVLAQGALPWQTTTKPIIYINPYRRDAAELAVKGRHELPLIQLESKKNKTRVPKYVHGNNAKTESIKLEGDFNKYFELRCEVGQQLIALQVMNPSLMQHIIDTQQFYDVQIYGSSIYITTDCKHWTKEFINGLIEHAQTLSKVSETVQKITDARIN